MIRTRHSHIDPQELPGALLTVKSDDIIGRVKTYEAIVKGENLPKPGIPEAMNVLLHELRGLALSVKLE